ncbi:MAG: helix-turn-helix domain-containing protein [Bacteroidetes bacterium]|nr:helix-turn-helix domain-containing protein [Bacteroidota bacterium]
MKSTTLHIGENILSVMNQKGITKAELARMLKVKPQSVDYLLKRKSVDTDTLYNISVVLDFDFSKFYSINQTFSEQTNFDINQSKAKVLVEISLNVEDIVKLNLKNRIVQILDK